MEDLKYTDKEALENYLLKNIDDQFNDQIDSWINAMSIYIDNFCNRNIYRDTEEKYTYDGDGDEVLHIKDCCEISSVTVDGDEVEVYKYPKNKPYASRLVRKDGLNWAKGRENILVTGYQAMNKTLPENIKYVCTVLVAGIINNQIFGDKNGNTERIGSYSVTYRDKSQNTDFDSVKKILSSYKRIAI